jgi:PAS domain S-box-containing protein
MPERATSGPPGGVRVRAEGVPTTGLAALHRRLLGARSAASIMDAAVESVTQHLGSDAAIVLLVEGGRVARAASRGYPKELAEALVGRPVPVRTPLMDALVERRPLYFPDLAAFHARYPHLTATAALFAAHASLPLEGDGGTFGEMFLSWRQPRAFAKRDQAALEGAAALVAQAMWRARLLDARDESGSRLRARDAFLTDATVKLLAQELDPQETLGLVTRLCVQDLAQSASVLLIEASDACRRVSLARATGAPSAADPPPPNRELRRAIESIPRGETRIQGDGTLLAPLVGRSGLLGALELARAAGREPGWSEEDVFVAKSLATRCALAYESARLHQETRALESQWRALYERHERVIETAPAQVLTIDASGRILSINHSVRGADPRLALGLNAFDTVVEGDRARVRSIILDAMRTGRIAEYETQAVLGPGSTRWFHVRVGALDLGGGARGAVLVSTDIEERKAADREVAQVRAQLAKGEKLAALGSLVSGVAHELRTPLTYLANNAFLVERRLATMAAGGKSSDEALEAVRPFLREIASGVDRLNLLVEDLRKYTRAGQTASVDLAPLDTMLTEAIELFLAANRGIHPIERSLSPTRRVRANRGAIQQLLLNLLQNASEASASGSPIRVVTRQEGTQAILEVVDHGCGIPADVQERMFEPLYTTKPDGTGLGLSIVKRIADDHQATVHVATRDGHGTTFTLLFPTE